MQHRVQPFSSLSIGGCSSRPRLVHEVNGQHHYGGDLSLFESAPIIPNAVPGGDTVNVRMIRDVHANGSQMPPVP